MSPQLLEELLLLLLPRSSRLGVEVLVKVLERGTAPLLNGGDDGLFVSVLEVALQSRQHCRGAVRGRTSTSPSESGSRGSNVAVRLTLLIVLANKSAFTPPEASR